MGGNGLPNRLTGPIQLVLMLTCLVALMFISFVPQIIHPNTECCLTVNCTKLSVKIITEELNIHARLLLVVSMQLGT